MGRSENEQAQLGAMPLMSCYPVVSIFEEGCEIPDGQNKSCNRVLAVSLLPFFFLNEM